jgi:hypothetical protein
MHAARQTLSNCSCQQHLQAILVALSKHKRCLLTKLTKITDFIKIVWDMAIAVDSESVLRLLKVTDQSCTYLWRGWALLSCLKTAIACLSWNEYSLQLRGGQRAPASCKA